MTFRLHLTQKAERPKLTLNARGEGEFWLALGTATTEVQQMRPRTAGKIVLSVLTVLFALLSILYALNTKDVEKIYHGFRALTFALLALTTATAYRYFED